MLRSPVMKPHEASLGTDFLELSISQCYSDVGFSSVQCEQDLLPLVNTEAAWAYDKAEQSKTEIPKRER